MNVPTETSSGRITYGAVIAAVQRSGFATPGNAAASLRATLETLAEFASRDQAARLAAHLPLELRPCLLSPPETPPNPVSGEFFLRVALRENTDLVAATTHARGVLSTLTRLVPAGLVREQLPANCTAPSAEVQASSGSPTL